MSISFWGIVAKLLGLLREGVFANYFGTSAEMDVFGLIGGYATTLMSIPCYIIGCFIFAIICEKHTTERRKSCNRTVFSLV